MNYQARPVEHWEFRAEQGPFGYEQEEEHEEESLTDAEKLIAVETSLDGNDLIANVRGAGWFHGWGLCSDSHDRRCVDRAVELWGEDFVSKLWSQGVRWAEEAFEEYHPRLTEEERERENPDTREEEREEPETEIEAMRGEP